MRNLILAPVALTCDAELTQTIPEQSRV